ncbi:MAG: amidohydrolase family protein, partial [Clostridiales bacterium]|nr:amidohydrolase family protein [Clostridiales bacterium]
MLIKNAEVFCSDFKFRKTDLEFIGGRIETIPAVPPARDDSVLNLEGHYIVPGFIDIHIHGCNGHDIMDSEFSDNAIYEMDKFLLKNGVTSWCGTTMSYSKGSLNKIVSKGRMHTRAVSEANDQGRTHTRAVSEANDQGRTHTRAVSEANDQGRTH